MIRGLIRWSLRLGVLAAVAFVVKKMIDAQRPEPAPIRLVDPPAPRPSASPQRPATPARPTPVAPVAKVAPPVERVTLVTPPKPVTPATPEPGPAPEAPAATPAPAKVEEPPTVKRPRRTEPLKAKRAAEQAQRPTRANRNGSDTGTPKPRSQMVSWVEPLDGVCPTSHPIKAKLGSKVFRKPSMPTYASSKPDRCYASEGAARRAGFTEAQR